MTVASADPVVRSVDYTIKASVKEQCVGQSSGSLALSGAIPQAPGGLAAVTGAPSVPGDLWGLVRRALAEHRTAESPSRGGGFSMRDAYAETPPEGAIIVGFVKLIGALISGE